MRVRNRLCGRIAREHVLLLGLAVLVALAGCSGAGTGDETATGTPANATTPTETPTDDGTTTDRPKFGESLGSDLTPAEQLSVQAEGVTSDAIDALEAVETYRLTGTSTLTTKTNNLNTTRTIERATRVNRTRHAIASNQTATVRGQTIASQSYIVNETLYRHSKRFVRRFNSEWIKQDISRNFSQRFARTDRLAIYKRALENGTVTLRGAQQVNGERTYRLRVRTDRRGFAEIINIPQDENTTVSLTMALWVSADTGRVVRAEGDLTIRTPVRGQSVTITGGFTEHVTYRDVDVRLPDAATTAVTVGN